jgi:serine/threonine protein kinase
MMAYNFMQILFEGLEPYSLSTGVTITDKELGRGSYATVFELEYLGLKCAGKKIHEILIQQEENSMIYAVRRFKDECQILSQVRHPNIVQFLGVFFQQGDHIPILVTEFLPLNLDQCLDRYNLPKERRYSILHDVALGLNYLHSQCSPIIHRDLSSNNVLLTSNMGAKISDLGVARILNLSPQKVTYLTKAPGTPAFMPPEAMIADPKYDTSIDIFSYGILMIHTLSGQIPVPQIESIRTEGDRLIPVSEAERREPFLEVIGKDHPLMDLILKCIHNNPEMRANTVDIVDRLADTVELHPISFTNQLDMIEYISRLEEETEGMERKNYEYINSQTLENAKRTREAISKLEKEQEEARTELQTLQHSMEKAIDHLKASLTDEVQKVLNRRAQSTTHDLNELREELKRVESSTVIPRSPASRQRRIYENMPPTTLNAIKETKSNEYTRQSDSEPRIRKRSLSTSIVEERPGAKKQSPQPRPKSLSAAVDSAPTDGEFGLQHTRVAQKNTLDEGKTSQQPMRAAGKSSSVPDTTGIAKQTTRGKSGTRDDACLVYAIKHPSKVGSKPPVSERKRTQPGQGPIPMLPKRTERSITTSNSELELSTKQDTEPRCFNVEKVINYYYCILNINLRACVLFRKKAVQRMTRDTGV